jgi:hypothetical protein
LAASGFASDEFYAGDGPPAYTWVGVGLLVAGSLSWIPQMYYARVANDEKVSAFVTYNDSLRKRLSLCVDGLRVIDCAAAPAPTTIHRPRRP